MSTSPFKETKTSSTNLRECCERCGKDRESNLGGTITRWFFRSVICECPENDSFNSHALATVASTEEGTGKSPCSASSDGKDQAPETFIDLGDRYEILETIGEGGMGTVHRLKDRVLDKEFAVKVLRDDFATDASAIKRFEQEADAASQLTHPNILTTYGRGSTTTGVHYILMDLLKGESLAHLLKRETRLDVSRVIDLSTQICDALAHAHMKGLIHRDLKPSNIMLTNGNEVTATVKVLDFGIAKLKATSNRETQNLTATGELFGSPAYMSPEQCLGCAVDARSDVYSLGCMMYEMLCGHPPFDGKNHIKTVVQHLKDEPPPLTKKLANNRATSRLQAIIMRCLEKSSAQRYQSMEDLKADLELVAAGRSPKQAKKRRLKEIPMSWAVASTAILIVGAWVTWQLPIQLVMLLQFGPVNTILMCLLTCLSAAETPCMIICAFLWCAVLVQAGWKKINRVPTSRTELHEYWVAATLVLLTICALSALALFCTSQLVEDPRSPLPKGELSQLMSTIQGPAQMLSVAFYMLAWLSAILAFFAVLGWVCQRSTYAFGLSLQRQRLVALVYLSCLALVGMFGYRNLAWLAYGQNRYLYSNWKYSYRLDPGLDLALAIDPNFAPAYYGRGERKLRTDIPGAISDFSKVIELKSDKSLESEALQRRAQLYADSGDFAKASIDLQRAITLDPNLIGIWGMSLAYFYNHSNQVDRALSVYNDLIKEIPNYALAYAKRSKLYLRKGNFKQALDDINKALSSEQCVLNYYVRRAEIYEKLKQMSLATEDYNTVLKNRSLWLRHQPDMETYYQSLGIAEEKLGLSAQAKLDYARAAEEAAKNHDKYRFGRLGTL